MCPALQPQVHSIADVVREELQHSLGVAAPPQPEPEAMSYAAVARHAVTTSRNHQRPAPSQFRHQTPPPPSTPSRPPAGQRYSPRKTDVWRAPDNRPLCYHCGEAGHTYRRCQYRQMGLRSFAVNAPPPQSGELPRDIADYLATTEWAPRRTSCSPSPGRYRSPQRRQQYSGPNRGRFASPYSEN